MTRDTEQEVKPCEFVNGVCVNCEATEREECEGWICPPKRPWVGLTDAEIKALATPSDDVAIPMTGRMWIFVGEIEAKLKEKNT
jgi:hypothetical protein